jgi:hypothetical protein
MGRNKDLLNILTIVLIGMFIPFIGSITITYGLNIFKIGITFVYFLLIFGVELLLVYLYFTITNWVAGKEIDKYKPGKP